MKHAALLAGCVLGFGCLFLGWREWRHRGELIAWGDREALLRRQVEELNSAVEEREAGLKKSEALRVEVEIDRESFRDRATNLTAQRDHLQTENKRLSARIEALSLELQQSRKDLESVRHNLLQLSAEPRRLEAELNLRKVRIEKLEALLDEQLATESNRPPLWSVEGLSSDQSVIAIAGEVSVPNGLPCPVQVCRKDQVLLDCWINRIEEGVLVCHVEDWRVPASTLVKGEKVFILRSRNHDADP